MYKTYFPQGVCSRQIDIDVDPNGIIKEVLFIGGCHGNTQGVCRLAEGRSAKEVASLLKGIDCRGKGTSCPDQLARALEEIIAKM